MNRFIFEVAKGGANVAVATHGGATFSSAEPMEADTIYGKHKRRAILNGRNATSQIGSDNFINVV